MVNTMFILDRTLNTSHILTANKNSQSAFWEDTYTQEFDTGAESLEFSCYTHESVKEGNYVAFFYNSQYKMFQITEIEEVHKSGKLVSECYCETASLQLLNNHVRPFSGDMNCIQFFEHILSGTEWRIGKYSNSLKDKVMTINEGSIESVWSLIEDYKDLFGCEINTYVTYDNGHVTGQFIDIFSEKGLGSTTFKRFEYGKNVTGITKSKDLYDWCTGIIIDCNCDVTNTIIDEYQGYGFVKGAGDVILDDNHNRMYNAGRTHVIGVYSGDETEPIEACINAWKELEKRSVPKFDYKVTTALRDDEYEEIHLGDTVYVVDHSYTPPLLLEARVGKLELSFTDRSQNTCTLTNYKEIKSKLLDADYIKLTGTITDIVNAFFPITSEGIADGAIVDGKIETTYFQQITADIVSAGIGAFESLYVQGLTVINADIEKLNATSADITELKAQVADIDTLVNGHLTSDNIQSMIITGDKFTVADGFIKNAMIDNITADKITTGSINTDNVYISSADGSMILNGSLQQFKDKDGNVRIQIGKDAQDNFTFSLFDEDGTGVLINEKGITENAIADGLIVNDHVADDANISGSKLDIDSVVTEINNGTTTIKGSKVVLDENNQSLSVAFNSLETKVDSMKTAGTNLLIKSTKTPDAYLNEVDNFNIKSSAAGHSVSDYIRVVPSTQYTLSYYSTNAGNGDYRIVYYKDDKTLLSGEKITNTGEFYYTVTIPPDGAYVRISAPDYDNTKFEKGDEPTDFTIAPQDLEDKIIANSTAINVQQGQIDTLIANTTITKEDGQTVSLKDDYNITKSTVNSQSTKIGSLETTVNEVSSKQASMELDLDGFRTEVSNTYATKGEVNLSNLNMVNNGNFKNCYPNTKDMIPSWIAEDPLAVINIPSSQNNNCLKLYNSREASTRGLYQDVVLKDGTTYTLTFNAGWEQNVTNGVTSYIGFYNAENSRVHTITVPVANNIDNLGQPQTVTFTTPTDVAYHHITLKFYIGGAGTSGEVEHCAYIGNIKIEEGNEYTGWRGSEYDETTRIGGTNYIKNGDFSQIDVAKNKIDSWTIGGEGKIYKDQGTGNYTKKGMLYFQNSQNADVYSGFYQYVYGLEPRGEYTLTFDIDWESNVREAYVDLVFYDENNARLFDAVDLKPSKEGRYSYTFAIPPNAKTTAVGFCHRGSYDSGAAFLGILGNVMLERGSVATDWSESPNYFTSKTEFLQTNEDFTFKISQSGGGNLIQNSKCKNGTFFWYAWEWDGSNTSYKRLDVSEPWSGWNWEKERCLRAEQGVINNAAGSILRGGMSSEHISVKPYTTYSFSCYTDAHRAGRIVIEIYTNETGAMKNTFTPANIVPKWHEQYDTNYTNWTRVEYTFTTGGNTTELSFVAYMEEYSGDAVNNSACMWVALPCLVEGSVPMLWAPHESELYEGIVKINETGLQVQHGNNRSVLDSQALKFYGGSSLYSMVDGGIFKFANPGNASSTVGMVGRYSWVESGAFNSCLAAGPGSSSSIGSVRNSGEAATCMIIDSSQAGHITGSNRYLEQGLNIIVAECDTLHFKQNKQQASLKENGIDALTLWGGNYNNDGRRTGMIWSADSIAFGIVYAGMYAALKITEADSPSNHNIISMYGPLDMNGFNIYNCQAYNTLSARSSYTQSLLNSGSNELYTYGAYSFNEGEVRWCWKETVFTYPEADIDPETDEWVYTGRNICYIELPIFLAENIEADYHIQVGKIGWGDYRILEKTQYYFILESQEEDFAFTFEIVAKLVDGETLSANTSLSSMATAANPALGAEPPEPDDGIIIEGSEEAFKDREILEEEMVVEEIQDNINTGEE